MLKIIIPLFFFILFMNISFYLENKGSMNYLYVRIFIFKFKINISKSISQNKFNKLDLILLRRLLKKAIINKLLVTKYELYNENNNIYYISLYVISNFLKRNVKEVKYEEYRNVIDENKHELDFKIVLSVKIVYLIKFIINLLFLKFKRRIYGRKNKHIIKS